MNEYLISSLEQQLKKDPGSRVFFRLAEELRKGEAYDRAIEVAEEGIGHHPGYLPALVCLGRCYQQVGRVGEAEAMFRRVLEQTPDNPHALRGLGFILQDRGREAEGAQYLELFLLAEPGDEEALACLERLRTTVTRYDEDTKPIPEIDDSLDTEPAIPDFDTEPDAEVVTLEEEAPVEALEALPEEVTLDRYDERDDPDDDTEQITYEPGQVIREQADPIEVELAEAIAAREAESEAADALLSEELGAPATPVPMTVSDEMRLTVGLKHEKAAHYEAAYHIYTVLLNTYPGDRIVSGHHDRLTTLMAREGRTPKKIRLLSNWLDKIKGVYHVR